MALSKRCQCGMPIRNHRKTASGKGLSVAAKIRDKGRRRPEPKKKERDSD